MKKRRKATAQKTLDGADAKRRGRGDGPTDDGGEEDDDEEEEEGRQTLWAAFGRLTD